MKRIQFLSAGPRVLSLLSFASWLLLAVSWVMSFYAYRRLPPDIVAWSSLWSGPAAWEAKSASFFFYPLVQTIFILGFLLLAKATFFRNSAADFPGGTSPGRDDGGVLQLKKEIVSLGLIFVNLVFIHLQTTVILVSHGLAKGVNRFYFGMLLVVLAMLVPYYRVRRRMIRPGPRRER
jgi:hypothetical protein